MASDPVPVGDRYVRRERRPGLVRRLAYTLLVLECMVVLVPSIYGRLTPKLFGIPFFYWFQLLWIIVAMVITGIVYLLTTTRGPAPPEAGARRQPGDQGGVN
jgi:hypothetical protein